MQVELLNDQGQAASNIDVLDTVFGRDYNESLVHQIVVAYQANARQGARAQKDRGTVKHSTKKPFKQKGTGRGACWYDFFSHLAWRRSRFPKHTIRELHTKSEQEDVPRWYGLLSSRSWFVMAVWLLSSL